MKYLRPAMGAIAWFGLLNPALGAETCVTSHDASALKAAAVQQQLMVAAFMCHDLEAYNRFVLAYQGELQSSDAVLKSFFVHRKGGHGEADYDKYKTKAANLSALEQAKNTTGFCAATGQLYDAALAQKISLDDFVAAAPPAPGMLDVCIAPTLEAGNRPVVQVAAIAPPP